MTTVAEAFEIFRQRLEITQTEQDDASRRQREVREVIAKSFDIKRDFLTGSYARHTKTKLLKDIDIFFVLGPKEAQRRNEPPSKTLDAFEKCLVDAYGRDRVERNRRSITVTFDKASPTADEDGKVLSVDAVPAFEKTKYFEIPDDKLGTWIKSDPERHAELATQKNKSLGGKWIPLVKMIKRWNRSAGKPIKPSFLVEVMALELIDGPFVSYPNEVRRFFAAALSGLDQDWPEPAGHGPAVSDQMTSDKRTKAKEAVRAAEVKATLATRLEAQGNSGEALRLWREIMGKYFPAR